MLKWTPDWLNYRRQPFRHPRNSFLRFMSLDIGFHSSRGKLTEHVLGLRPTAPSSANFALSRCCWARLDPSVLFKRARNAFRDGNVRQRWKFLCEACAALPAFYQLRTAARRLSWLFWEFARIFSLEITNPAFFSLFLHFRNQIHWRAACWRNIQITSDNKFAEYWELDLASSRVEVVQENSQPYWSPIRIERKSDDDRCSTAIAQIKGLSVAPEVCKLQLSV